MSIVFPFSVIWESSLLVISRRLLHLVFSEVSRRPLISRLKVFGFEMS